MRHFPIFLDLAGRRVVVSGAGETAVAKLRLLLKTEAAIHVFGEAPSDVVATWANSGRLVLTRRAVLASDLAGAALVYGANDDDAEDGRVAALARSMGILANIVDRLEESDFITPAIIDRDPVVVAIGTEGAAPVLAREIKADAEQRLAPGLGALARAGRRFRGRAEALSAGRARRRFWRRYYKEVGPRVLDVEGEAGLDAALERLLGESLAETAPAGRVDLIGAGPGDPELLTLKARNRLHDADVVIYDRLVAPEILELARREARLIEVGKTPGGVSWRQENINALLIAEARAGHQVARLKSGDPTVFGRLDEETAALHAAGVDFDVVPGITAASAAAASLKASLTRRGRNSSVQFLTGQDMAGFAEQDWRALSRPGAAAAIYMGVRAARFIQGRLMLHGADAQTPVSVVENASRASQKLVTTRLGALTVALDEAAVAGPAVLFLGVAPHEALALAETPTGGVATIQASGGA